MQATFLPLYEHNTSIYSKRISYYR